MKASSGSPESSGKKRPELPEFEATLPMAGAPPGAGEGEDLDLELDDIQTRLPYGSEDIADK